MQSIGETIEFRASRLRNEGVGQRSRARGDGTPSFPANDSADLIFAADGIFGAQDHEGFCAEHLQAGCPDERVNAECCHHSGEQVGGRRVRIEGIYRNRKLRRLPVIGAMSMTGDHETCLEADASRCLAKPVNTEQPSSTRLKDAAASLIGGENARQ